MVLAPFASSYAFDNSSNSETAYGAPGQVLATPFTDSARSARLSLLTDYVRKNAPGWMPGAPAIVRNPSRWFAQQLGLGDDEGAGTSSEPSIFQPISSLMQPPAPEEANAMWFSPGYHHKGFLPLRDSIVMGVNLRQSVLDDRLQFDVHPFAGQNWLSSNGYWGTEMAVSLRDSDHRPWGKVALRFNNGDNQLMDQSRGYDMHTELDFSEHLSLHAGMSRNQTSDLGNYVLVRWKLGGWD